MPALGMAIVSGRVSAVAFLKVIKGSTAGQIYKLDADRMVMGRHPNCEIVLEVASVSRYHAQILENHGSFFLEDMRSRNHTYLNGRPIDGRTELCDSDTIKVCDVVFRFHEQLPRASQLNTATVDSHALGTRDTSGSTPDGYQEIAVGEEPSEDVPEDLSDASSVITTVSTHSSAQFRLGVNPEAKLRAVLEIGQALASTLNLDEVFRKTLDVLFRIFPQADSGFILLKDAEQQTFVVRAARTRNDDESSTARISMTVVKQVMETADAVLSADAVTDKRFETSESVSNLRICSMMCAPLRGSDGTALGVAQIDTEDLQNPFTEDDLDMLCSVVAQAALAIENASLHEKLIEQRENERDLELATQIQLDFLPNNRPKLDDYRFCDYYEAALHVGGDYFDYVSLPDGRVAIAVGDVAGKGVSAALLMASLYSTARFHLLTQPTVAQAITNLNAEVASGGLGHRFITFVAVILDPVAHVATIANAGHLPPLIRTSNRWVEIVAPNESGMPLGVAPDQQFQEARIQFEPGDTLVLYTDGITEAMNPANQIYGRPRLSRYIFRGPQLIDELVDGVVDDVEQFCEGRAQRDDMCLTCLQRTK